MGQGTYPDLNRDIAFFILLTDSLCLCASLNPRKLNKSVKVRDRCFMIHKNITNLTAQYPKITVKYCHVQSEYNPSDYGSKLVSDPITLVCSKLWLHGPDF